MASTAPKHLFIGIPSRDGRVSAALHRWLLTMSQLSATGQVPFRVTELVAEGYSPVHYARNIISAEALKTDADRIVMIDDDMLPDDTTWKVIRSDADICVPRMFRFRHNGPIAAYVEDDRPPEIASCATFVHGEGELEVRQDIIPTIESPDAEIEVQAAGTGFISIRREVLEDERMHVAPPDSQGVPALFQMHQLANGRIVEWEDVDFTLRAHRLGYKVVANFGAHCGHRKAINLDAVFEMVYRGNQSEELVAERTT